MQKQPKRYRGFITHSREDEAKARRLHKALERYRVPRGVDFEAQGKRRRLGQFYRDGEADDFGAALQGALADSESLIAICSPQAVASDRVEQQIIHFRALEGDEPVLAVIVKGRPHAADSPNPRKAARECLPAALIAEVEPNLVNLRKDGMARTRARIAAAVLDVPFEDLWRRDRGRAWGKRLMFGAFALCVAGAAAFGGLAMLGLEMRRANVAAQVIEDAEVPVDIDAAAATVVACEASLESVRAWDAAQQVGMRAKEYREMEKIGSVFREMVYACAATTGRRSTRENAKALCDRLNFVTPPALTSRDSPTYAEAIGVMTEQLQTVRATCAERLK